MAEEFDEEYDFVVVGSGGGSMCAGLVLREAGKSVLILEKTDLLGGSTARAGGVMWIPNNRFMAADGVQDSEEQANLYLDAVVGDHNDTPGATRERRQAYVREAPAMVDFLVAQGIKLGRSPYWPDYYDEKPGGVVSGRTVVPELFNINELGSWKDKLRANRFAIPVPIDDAATYLGLIKTSRKAKWIAAKMVMRGLFAKLTGKHYVTAGAALQGRMLQAALKAGIELRTDAPVREMIVDDGRVIGVLSEIGGQPRRIGARLGVLLNAGGFAHNQEMLDQYIPHVKSEWSHAAPGDTGDMHKELLRLGAWMAQMDEMVGNQMVKAPDEPEVSCVQSQISKPHAFLVDQSGVRYMNEAGSYMEFCRNQLERHKTVPAVPSYWIFDQRYLKTYMVSGSLPGVNKPQIWTETGFLKSAPTIEQLAREIGVDPASLAKSTERFNSFARSGRDEEFHRGERKYDEWLGDYTSKHSASLGTVEEAPFHAIEVVPGNVGTFGGVVTDSNARVLREDGTVIEGLYATGTTTAAVMGRAYPGAGCSIGPSFTWGYVAAKHAAGKVADSQERLQASAV